MAVLQGISGMQLGDGQGGKIALAIDKAVVRILADGSMAYKTATMMNPNQVKSGSVSYYVPEYIGSNDYGANGDGEFDIPQSGIITINIDTRRKVKYEIETFDMERLGDMTYVIDMVANATAQAITKDLNAHFWAFVIDKLTNDTEIKKQNIEVDKLFLSPLDENNQGEATPEECRSAMNKIQFLLSNLSKKYDKKTMGIPKADFLTFLDPDADVNMRNAFWGILNGMEYSIAPDLQGVQLGTFKYSIDNMLKNEIPAGTSFSKDKTLDTKNFCGVVVHNEAIAMPFNYLETVQLRNPDNANLRWITKYQFGIGIVRPSLIWGLCKTKPAARAK